MGLGWSEQLEGNQIHAPFRCDGRRLALVGRGRRLVGEGHGLGGEGERSGNRAGAGPAGGGDTALDGGGRTDPGQGDGLPGQAPGGHDRGAQAIERGARLPEEPGRRRGRVRSDGIVDAFDHRDDRGRPRPEGAGIDGLGPPVLAPGQKTADHEGQPGQRHLLELIEALGQLGWRGQARSRQPQHPKPLGHRAEQGAGVAARAAGQQEPSGVAPASFQGAPDRFGQPTGWAGQPAGGGGDGNRRFDGRPADEVDPLRAGHRFRRQPLLYGGPLPPGQVLARGRPERRLGPGVGLHRAGEIAIGEAAAGRGHHEPGVVGDEGGRQSLGQPPGLADELGVAGAEEPLDGDPVTGRGRRPGGPRPRGRRVRAAGPRSGTAVWPRPHRPPRRG